MSTPRAALLAFLLAAPSVALGGRWQERLAARPELLPAGRAARSPGVLALGRLLDASRMEPEAVEALPVAERAEAMKAALAAVADEAISRARALAAADDDAALESVVGALEDLGAAQGLLDAARLQRAAAASLWARERLAHRNAGAARAKVEGLLDRGSLLRGRGADGTSLDMDHALQRATWALKSIEAAGDPWDVERLRKGLLEAKPGAARDWLDFLRVHDQMNPGAWTPQTVALLPSVAAGLTPQYSAYDWYYEGIAEKRAPALLSKPKGPEVELMLLHYAIGDKEGRAARDWPGLLELVAAMKPAASLDRLRGVIHLLQARVFRKTIPDALWERLLSSPPSNKAEREAVGFLARAANHVRHGSRAALGQALEGAAGADGYEALARLAAQAVFTDIAAKGGRTAAALERLTGDAVMREALHAGDFMHNVVGLSSFLNRGGQRLLAQMLESLVAGANGRLSAGGRYALLEGKIRGAVLERWKEDYRWDDAPESASGADADLGRTVEGLRRGLGGPERLARAAAAVEASLAGEKAVDAGGRALLETARSALAPAALAALGELEAGRRPSAADLKVLARVLGKRHRLADALPDAEAAWAAVKELLAPEQKAKAEAARRRAAAGFLSTDDPAAILRLGSEPVMTCQRCTEETDQNRAGQPVGRVLSGQFRAGYWTQGGVVAARAVLEIGLDQDGRPALFVNRLYERPGMDLNERVRLRSLVDYARHLGVAAVYFTKPPATASGWSFSQERPFSLFRRRFTPVHEEGFPPPGFGAKALSAAMFGAAEDETRSPLTRLAAWLRGSSPIRLGFTADGRPAVRWEGRIIPLAEDPMGKESGVFRLETPAGEPSRFLRLGLPVKKGSRGLLAFDDGGRVSVWDRP